MIVPVKQLIIRGIAWLSNQVQKRDKIKRTYWLSERLAEYNYVIRFIDRFAQFKENKPVPKVLDIGPGRSPFPALLDFCGFDVTAIDLKEKSGFWSGYFNQYYPVKNHDITKPLNETFDIITSISTLKHIDNREAAFENIFNALRPGGIFVFTAPYSHFKSFNAYDHPSAGYGKDREYPCHIFSFEFINRMKQKYEWLLFDEIGLQVFTGEFWTQGKRLYPTPEQFKPDLAVFAFEKPVTK